MVQSFAACSGDEIDSEPEIEIIDDGDDAEEEGEGEGEDDESENDDFDTGSKDTIIMNAITIKFVNNKEAGIDNPLETSGLSVSQNGDHIVITSTITETEVNYVLSGSTTDGSIKIYSDYKFGLVLNGVIIMNPNSSAINIQSGKKVTVLLVGGTSNRLIDSENYTTDSGEEDAKATFFSEGQLNFEGSGALLIKGKNNHAICSDDYIRIKGGDITVAASVKDGIHVNDYFRMDGHA